MSLGTRIASMRGFRTMTQEQLAAVVAAAYRARPYDAGWWER